MTEPSAKVAEYWVMGSSGVIQLPETAIVDAHNHLWIDPIPGADPGAPVLTDRGLVRVGLKDFRRLGGTAVVDCQPPGCGRNGLRLRKLSDECDVHVIACTGFHLRKYYPPEHWLFQANVDRAVGFFLDEIRRGLTETRSERTSVQAGFIKIACERTLQDTPLGLMEAAATAALEAEVAVAVHTERGSAAHAILTQLNRFGLPSDCIILCHMDKRPYPGLHRELADRGALLEYDTFFRPKYDPENNLWPLLEELVADGYSDSIALATDMAEPEMWASGNSGSDLSDLLAVVKPRLTSMGISSHEVHSMLGGNIVARLALRSETELGKPKEHS